MKKSLALAIILALLCTLLPVAVIASPLPRGWDDGLMPMYVAFTNTYCSITVSGTNATCQAGGSGLPTDIDYITVAMSLWSGPIGSTTYPTEVNTWPLYTSGGSGGGISKTQTVSSSKDYQLIATIKAYKNNQLVDIDYKTDYYLN